MRDHWSLPNESQFKYTGPDWLLLLLERCSNEQRDMTKLILWRAWSIHNNNTHLSGRTSANDSVHFILNLWETMQQVKQAKDQSNVKGKAPWWPPNQNARSACS